MGKTSVFLNLLEEETFVVRWHPNGLDLTRFHDLVGSFNLLTLSSSTYKRRGALMEKGKVGFGLELLAWLECL